MEVFTKGERVRYVPSHANGDWRNPDCQDGVVKRMAEDGDVFVIYDNAMFIMETGDEPYTAAKTRATNLIKIDSIPQREKDAMSNKAQQHINKLGFQAKEVLTGMTGVITSVSFDINGCIQCVLQPPMKEDKIPDGKWFDIARLEITSDAPIFKSPNYVEGAVAEGKSGAVDKPLPGQ